jgi:hypothetical protein
MANKRGMIQVAGTTYRIQPAFEYHEVIRISDDRKVGAFQHRPALRVLEAEIAAADLLHVARAALRSGRLPWAQADLSLAPIQPGSDARRRDPSRSGSRGKCRAARARIGGTGLPTQDVGPLAPQVRARSDGK